MPLSDIMAAWWVAAEAFLLLLVEWGARYVRGEGEARLSKASFCILGFALAGLIALVVRAALPDLIGSSERDQLLLRRSIWNALCVLWVGFEAGILVYLARIVRAIGGRSSRGGAATLPGIVLVLAALYVAWHLPLWRITVDPAWGDTEKVVRLYHLFVRICGVFWVVVEAACAVVLFRAWRLVKARLA